MAVLRDKVNVVSSRNLLPREASYDTASHRTMLPLQQIKETEVEIRTRIMEIIPEKDGEGEPIRMNPDSSEGIYVTASVEAEYHMIAQN